MEDVGGFTMVPHGVDAKALVLDQFYSLSSEEKFAALAKGLIFQKENADALFQAQARTLEQLQKENDDLKANNALGAKKIEALENDNKAMHKKIDKIDKLINLTEKVAAAGVAGGAIVGPVFAAALINPLLGLAVGGVELGGMAAWGIIEEEKENKRLIAKFEKDRLDLCKKLLPQANEDEIGEFIKFVDGLARKKYHNGCISDAYDEESIYYSYNDSCCELKKLLKNDVINVSGLNDTVIEKVTSIAPPKCYPTSPTIWSLSSGRQPHSRA